MTRRELVFIIFSNKLYQPFLKTGGFLDLKNIRRKEEAPFPIENPEQRACSAIGFILSPHVGRKDLPQILYNIYRLRECIPLLKRRGEDPLELLDVLQERMAENGENLPEYKQRLVGIMISIITGKKPPSV